MDAEMQAFYSGPQEGGEEEGEGGVELGLLGI